jgi:hypothetical protein
LVNSQPKIVKFSVSLMFVVIFLATHLTVGAETTCPKDEVIAAVNKACSILETDGNQGLRKVKEIRFCRDNYIFANDFQDVSLFDHPGIGIQYLFEINNNRGQSNTVIQNDFKNTAKIKQITNKSKIFYSGMGWVKYRWGKNEKYGTGEAYIRGCLMGGENVYVGAAINYIESK